MTVIFELFYSPCANMGKCIGRSSKKGAFPFKCECINGFGGPDCSINTNMCGVYGFQRNCGNKQEIQANKSTNSIPSMAPAVISGQPTSFPYPSNYHGNSSNYVGYMTLALLVILCIVIFSTLFYYSTGFKKSE